MNANKPVSLIEREIERKVDAALRAELAANRKKPADFGRRDFEAVARRSMEAMSPEAIRETALQGFQHIAECIFGEIIAEQLWSSGRGYAATPDEVVAIARELSFAPPEDAPGWLQQFREDISECTCDRLDMTYKSAERWRPLLAGEPDNAQIGEVALRKALAGNRLAQSFISGRQE